MSVTEITHLHVPTVRSVSCVNVLGEGKVCVAVDSDVVVVVQDNQFSCSNNSSNNSSSNGNGDITSGTDVVIGWYGGKKWQIG